MHTGRSGDRNTVGGDRGLPDRGYGLARRGDRWLPDRWYGMPGGSVTPPPSGLADGATIATWKDSGPNHNDGTKVGNPIFKTSILNGKPVVRLRSASQDGFNLASSISSTAPWTCFFVMKPVTPASNLFSLANTSPQGATTGLEGGGTFSAIEVDGYYQFPTAPYDTAFHIFSVNHFDSGGAFGVYADGTTVSGTEIPHPGLSFLILIQSATVAIHSGAMETLPRSSCIQELWP